MLAKLFGRSATSDERSVQVTPWGDWGTSSRSSAGINVTTTSARQLMAVYGCVQLIAGTISTLPRHIQKEETAEPVTTKPRWFDNPNPNTTMQEFVAQTVTSLLLDGNAYWVYGVDGNGMPNELYVLDPSVVTVKQTPGPISSTVVYEVRGKPFRGNLRHLKGIVAPGDVVGMSPIEAAKQSIGVGLAAQEFAARFYSNGTTMSGLIEAPADLTPSQAQVLRDSFAKDHAGVANAHRPGVITNGGKWVPLSVTPEQAQFLATRQFQDAQICSQLFLVDPAWFGMALGTGSNVTYSNLESQGVRLATFTLTRWLVTLERAFYELLPRPQELKFNLDGLKRGDLAARANYYTTATGGQPWMTQAEVRDLEDLVGVPTELKSQPVPQPLQAVPQMPAAAGGQ